MEYFNRLPVDITSDILTRLPTESVLDCKRVCKTWRRLIGHESFSKIHLLNLNRRPSSADDDSGTLLGFLAFIHNKQLTYFEYNENHESIQRIRKICFTPSLLDLDEFLGSYNGLICLSRWVSYKPICICNPINKEYVLLPEINGHCYSRGVNLAKGFGYVSSSNEYKVVLIMLTYEFAQVHIYTLGSSNGWRNLGKFDLGCGTYWAPGIFMNETLYWMGLDSRMIVTFDLAEEKLCGNLSPPPLPPVSNWWNNRLGVLDGLLFFADRLSVEGNLCFDIWILKKKDDNCVQREEHQAMVWSKEFRVDKCQLVAMTKTGSVLTLTTEYLSLYDPKASTSKRLVDLKNWFERVFPHRNTLVSLNELGEEDTKIMESVEVADAGSYDQP